MNVEELFNHIQQVGVMMTVQADDIEIDAPSDVLTDELRQAIRANKAELIRVSSPKSVSPNQHEIREQTSKAEKIRCYRCDDYTPHTEQLCDYPEYVIDWLLYMCKTCGSTTYARKSHDIEGSLLLHH